MRQHLALLAAITIGCIAPADHSSEIGVQAQELEFISAVDDAEAEPRPHKPEEPEWAQSDGSSGCFQAAVVNLRIQMGMSIGGTPTAAVDAYTDCLDVTEEESQEEGAPPDCIGGGGGLINTPVCIERACICEDDVFGATMCDGEAYPSGTDENGDIVVNKWTGVADWVVSIDRDGFGWALNVVFWYLKNGEWVVGAHSYTVIEENYEYEEDEEGNKKLKKIRLKVRDPDHPEQPCELEIDAETGDVTSDIFKDGVSVAAAGALASGPPPG